MQQDVARCHFGACIWHYSLNEFHQPLRILLCDFIHFISCQFSLVQFSSVHLFAL